MSISGTNPTSGRTHPRQRRMILKVVSIVMHRTSLGRTTPNHRGREDGESQDEHEVGYTEVSSR